MSSWGTLTGGPGQAPLVPLSPRVTPVPSAEYPYPQDWGFISWFQFLEY